jgi:hypothetical protein
MQDGGVPEVRLTGNAFAYYGAYRLSTCEE